MSTVTYSFIEAAELLNKKHDSTRKRYYAERVDKPEPCTASYQFQVPARLLPQVLQQLDGKYFIVEVSDLQAQWIIKQKETTWKT